MSIQQNAARRSRQGGATLLIALIMLVVLTLFAISAIRTGNIGFKIVGNQQAQKLMEAAAQQAIEQAVSNLGNFDPVTIVDPSWFSTTPSRPTHRVCVNAAAGDAPAVINPTAPSATWASWTTSCTSGTQVDVMPVRCISTKRSQFDSLTQPMATYDNVWEIVATVTDTLTGAKATYHQGVKIRMLSSQCPGLST
jgi:Tfp pilus assembly protein PilX